MDLRPIACSTLGRSERMRTPLPAASVTISSSLSGMGVSHCSEVAIHSSRPCCRKCCIGACHPATGLRNNRALQTPANRQLASVFRRLRVFASLSGALPNPMASRPHVHSRRACLRGRHVDPIAADLRRFSYDSICAQFACPRSICLKPERGRARPWRRLPINPLALGASSGSTWRAGRHWPSRPLPT